MTGLEITFVLFVLIGLLVSILVALIIGKLTKEKERDESFEDDEPFDDDEWDTSEDIYHHDSTSYFYATTSAVANYPAYTKYVETEKKCAWCGNLLVITDRGRCSSCGGIE